RVVPAQVLVLAQPLRHLLHQTLALQGGDGPGEAWAGHVEGRRERRAVGQPRLGAHDGRAAARTAVRDRDDPARRAAQLVTENGEVALGGGLLEGGPVRSAHGSIVSGSPSLATITDSQTWPY